MADSNRKKKKKKVTGGLASDQHEYSMTRNEDLPPQGEVESLGIVQQVGFA
jgi:hypothetical protein